MGVSLKHPFYVRIFHYKLSSHWESSMTMDHPQMVLQLELVDGVARNSFSPNFRRSFFFCLNMS